MSRFCRHAVSYVAASSCPILAYLAILATHETVSGRPDVSVLAAVALALTAVAAVALLPFHAAALAASRYLALNSNLSRCAYWLLVWPLVGAMPLAVYFLAAGLRYGFGPVGDDVFAIGIFGGYGLLCGVVYCFVACRAEPAESDLDTPLGSPTIATGRATGRPY